MIERCKTLQALFVLSLFSSFFPPSFLSLFPVFSTLLSLFPLYFPVFPDCRKPPEDTLREAKEDHEDFLWKVGFRVVWKKQVFSLFTLRSSPFLLPAYPIADWYLSDFHSWQRLRWDNPLYVQLLVSPQSFQCCINSCHSLILFLHSPTSAWISSISVSTEAFFFCTSDHFCFPFPDMKELQNHTG